MRVTINFEFDLEDDGIEGSVQVDRYNVDTLEDLMYAYQSGTVAAGYTYSEAIGCLKEDGNKVWSPY
jgi:hypothetical protein